MKVIVSKLNYLNPSVNNHFHGLLVLLIVRVSQLQVPSDWRVSALRAVCWYCCTTRPRSSCSEAYKLDWELV